MPDFLVDPREQPAAFLARFEGPADLRSATGQTSHRVRGELEVVASQPLSDVLVDIKLRRLSLYALESIGDDVEEPISGLSLSAHQGRGNLVPDGSGRGWILSMALRARANYDQLPPHGDDEEPSPEQDYRPPPSISLSGQVELRVELDTEGLVGRRLRIAQGTVVLSREVGSEASLIAVALGVENVAIHSAAAFLTPLLALPVRPVLYLLPNGTYSGAGFWNQLDGANEVWGRCCIQFVVCGEARVEDSSLASSKNKIAILNAYDSKEVTEIHLVVSEIAGYTGGAPGYASAAVILPKPRMNENEYLLAHELGHVLGGCHPDDPRCRWDGRPESILAVADPNDPRNPAKHCRLARKHCHPHLRNLLQDCRLAPDP